MRKEEDRRNEKKKESKREGVNVEENGKKGKRVRGKGIDQGRKMRGNRKKNE